MNIDFYERLIEKGKAKVVSIHTVWSNGKSIRRYQGQGDGYNRSPAKGYRKMTAILVEEVRDNE